MCGVALFFCALIVVPGVNNYRQNNPVTALSTVAVDPIQISDGGAGQFEDEYSGIYLCRTENPHKDSVFKITVGTDNLTKKNDNSKKGFYPEFQALIRRNDRWIELNNSDDFWFVEEDSSKHSIACYLKEKAPAAVYGVRCRYDRDGSSEKGESIFQILYTEYWTYIGVTSDDNACSIHNFAGGSNLTLHLNVTFNDGAADPNLRNIGTTAGSTGVPYGAITDKNNIVSVETMNIAVKTVSGKVYPASSLKYEFDSNDKNRVALRFLDNLEKDIYLVQFTSKANGHIIGQFVIDNTDMNGGVNLSQLWVVLMIVGGVLAFGAASAYLVPFFIVRINQARVLTENERVARMKNPEKYAKENKKSLKNVVSDVIYKIKTPAYKRKKEKEEEQPVPVEEKVYSNRFTEMLRERQEKRDYMRKHNVSSIEMEKMKEAEAAAAADEVNSFAALRDDDDDDEIATFHAAEDEVSTLETGSYVEGGTTFAKLDSMRENEQVGSDGNQGDDAK